MNNTKSNDIANKLEKIYDFSSPYIDPKKELLKSDLCLEIEKESDLVDLFFKENLNLPLSEKGLDNLYRFSKFLVDNKQLKEKLSEKNYNFFRAIQYVFGPYLHFGIPLSQWNTLAKESWLILKDYHSGHFLSIEDFSEKNQSQWEKCCQLLEKFKDHPIYGEKIKAKDWGYT